MCPSAIKPANTSSTKALHTARNVAVSTSSRGTGAWVASAVAQNHFTCAIALGGAAKATAVPSVNQDGGTRLTAVICTKALRRLDACAATEG